MYTDDMTMATKNPITLPFPKALYFYTIGIHALHIMIEFTGSFFVQNQLVVEYPMDM